MQESFLSITFEPFSLEMRTKIWSKLTIGTKKPISYLSTLRKYLQHLFNSNVFYRRDYSKERLYGAGLSTILQGLRYVCLLFSDWIWDNIFALWIHLWWFCGHYSGCISWLWGGESVRQRGFSKNICTSFQLCHAHHAQKGMFAWTTKFLCRQKWSICVIEPR